MTPGQGPSGAGTETPVTALNAGRGAMKELASGQRPGVLSVVMIVTSIVASAAISLAMDTVLLRYSTAVPDR